jgi:hypothetical protein
MVREMDFKDKESFEKYKSQHKMRSGTKVNIAGKETTVGATSGDKDSETGKDYTRKFMGTDEPDDWYDDSETGKDYTRKFMGTDEPKEFDNEFEQLSQAYLDADDHMAQNDFVEDFINQYKDSDLSDEEQEMYDDLKTAYEDGDNEGMDMVLGAYDDEDEWEESIIPQLKKEFKQYGFAQKSKNWKRITI